MKNKHPILAAAITLAVLSPGISSGALVATFTTATLASGSITATTGDLLQTVGSVAAAKDYNYPTAPNTNLTARAASLSDGTVGTGTAASSNDMFKGGTGESVTFNLNTAINSFGYDITSLKTIAYWTDGRAGQAWTVQFRTVGGSFTDFYTLDDKEASNVVSQVVLADGSSVIASGVDAIRFNFDDVKSGALNMNWAAYREIDVIGSASAAPVPEPSASLLGGLGMLALLRRRRA